MKTLIKTKTEATDKIVAGVTKLAEIVGMTLGSRGRTVAIAKSNGKEIYDRSTIDDGVNVAKSVYLEDEFEQMGLALVREAAQKQVDQVGDGTTGTIILASAIIKEAHKQIAQGRNPMEIRAELEEGVKILTKAIEAHKTPIKTDEETVQIATISSKNLTLGELIAGTYKKMGVDGVITVEESKSPDTTVEYQEGMQFDKGMASPYFVTDPQTMTAVHENPYVLVIDNPLMNFEDIMDFLNDFLEKRKALVIIAPEYGGTALPSFVQNKLEGKMISLLVNAPGFGDNQKAILGDIAILTGASVISPDTGISIRDIKLEHLGRAKLVTSGREMTTISGGGGTKENIQTRIKQIQSLITGEKSDFYKEKLKERLAKLSNGVAVIKVGGQTEVEMKERKERVLDAVSSTRCALKDGIVIGGEVIYLHLRNALEKGILSEALKKPFYQLLENSGLDVAEIGFDIKNPPKNMGVDVNDGKIKDMMKAGIIDPLSVPRQAIINAVSVAIQVIMIGGIVIPQHEPTK